jgi:hypothetical protein
MEISDTDDLDCSWIDKEEKLGSINSNYIREPIDDIRLFFIYTNCNLEIDHVSKDIECVNNGCIHKDRLLQIIQTKRHHNNKKYRLDDILSFQVDLEPEKIQSFSELDSLDDISASFFKSVPIFDEISCIPSIFIFHDVASIFFLFNEVDMAAKSILRNGEDSSRNRVTKKVRIMDNLAGVHDVDNNININSNNRKSMKRFMKKMKQTRKAFDS